MSAYDDAPTRPMVPVEAHPARPSVPPVETARMVDPALHDKVDDLAVQLAAVVEFIDILKGIGANAAKGGGMQGAMLRQFVPGIEKLG